MRNYPKHDFAAHVIGYLGRRRTRTGCGAGGDGLFFLGFSRDTGVEYTREYSLSAIQRAQGQRGTNEVDTKGNIIASWSGCKRRRE